MRPNQRLGYALAGAALLSSLTACGKKVVLQGPQTEPRTVAEIGYRDPAPSRHPSPTDAAPCDERDRIRWDFEQPQPRENRSVDLLFVVDTSSSLSAERARLAATLPAFVSALDPRSDVRIAVMLAHGGASWYSGRLYAPHGAPEVLSTRTRTVAEIQSRLSSMLSHPVPDVDEANGEAMMFSVIRSLRPDRVAEIQAQGFYREGAALSVVFVSDENDICFPPEKYGYGEFPDYVVSGGNIEPAAFRKYCVNPDGSAAVTPDAVLTAARLLKKDQGVSWAGVVHESPDRVPRGGEDSIGHGVLQLLGLAPQSLAMDLGASDYSQGLASLGNSVSRQLDLKTVFHLVPAPLVREGSISVRVDGNPVYARYDSAAGAFEISSEDAGAAGSEVSVEACRAE